MHEQPQHEIKPRKEKEPKMRLAELERLFHERPELIDGMKKVFSVSLRCALASDFEGRYVALRHRFEPYRDHPNDNLMIRTFQEFVDPPHQFQPERKTWKTDREAILGADAKKRCLAEMMFKIQEPSEEPSIWASLVFSANQDTAKRYWNQGQLLGSFAAPQDLRFHGIFIGQPHREKRVPLVQATEHPKFSNVAIDQALVKSLLKWIDRPIEECAGAVAEIEQLGQKLGFDTKKIETLKQAVRDFATYVKPEPTTSEQCFREVGRCFTAPHTFEDFARERHNLKIDTDFYEHSCAGYATFFHQVNLVDDKMVVDWTARQYHKFDKEPYPFVYPVGDERVKSFGPLRSMEIKKKREEE